MSELKRYTCGYCGYKKSFAEAPLCPKCLERTSGNMKSRMSIPVVLEDWSEQEKEFHYVHGDIQEFACPDGRIIRGAAQWREFLKRTGTVEMGRAEMKNIEDGFIKRKESAREEAIRAERLAPPVEPPSGEIRPIERSRLQSEIMNRVSGRPAPSVKDAIKLGLDVARFYGEKR